MLLVATAAAAPPCPPLEPERFRERLQAAEAADRPELLHEQLPDLLAGVRCLGGPLAPPDAAALHRLVAADAAWSGDTARARSARAAADRIDPRDGPAGADAMPAMGEGFGTSLAARVFVDGVESPVRMVGQPALVQVFDADGAPIDGAWVAADRPLPDWVAFPALDCPASVPIDQLLRRVAAAESAYTALDVPGFERALRDVAVGLPCVEARVGVAQAAAIHRLEGLRQFTHGADTAALRSFQEARVLDPGYAPAPEVVRPESALAELWDDAGRAAPGPYLFEPVPAGLVLEVDGVPSSVRPSVLPSIVQIADGAGRVWFTRYVPPGVRLPDFAPIGVLAEEQRTASLSPARAVYARMEARRASNARRIGLFTGSAVAFTVGAGAYVWHTTTYGEYFDLDTPASRLTELRRTSNAAAAVSGSAVALGTGLLAAAFFVR